MRHEIYRDSGLRCRVWRSPMALCEQETSKKVTRVEGTYELTVSSQTTTAGPGTIVFIPRNVVHRFKNVGDTTARMLDWSLPGGQDHYFKAISELAASVGLTDEKVMEINKKFDTNFLSATNLAALTAPIALFESLDGH